MSHKLFMVFFVAVCCSCVFAGNFNLGLCTIYCPEDCKLFNFENIDKKQNYKSGVGMEFIKGKAAFTEDVFFTNVSKEHLKIEFSSAIALRNRIGEHSFFDFALAFQSALEHAVEGSDKIYLTSNGVNIINIPKLRNVHLLDLLGMLKFRFSLGTEFKSKAVVKASYDFSAYPFEEPILKTHSVIDLIGLGSVSVSIFYELK